MGSTNVLADLMGAAAAHTESSSPADPLSGMPGGVPASNGKVEVTVDLGAAADDFTRPISKPTKARPSAPAKQQQQQQQQQPEEPPDVEYDDDELTFQIGSAAVAPQADGDEFDEFDAPDGLDLPVPDTPPGVAQIVPTQSGVAPPAPWSTPVDAAAAAAAIVGLEEERRLVAEAAEVARMRAEAQKAQEAAHAAAAEADEARQRAARIQEEMASAMRTVAAAGGGSGGTSGGATSAKSEVEKADEKARAMKGAKDTIAEDEDEEEEAAAAFEAAPPPVAPPPEAAAAPPSARALKEAKIMDQFDQATAAADASRAAGARGRGAGSDPRLKKILYDEASASLFELDLTAQLGSIVREDWATSASLLKRLVPALRPKLKNANLRAQRDRVMALAKVPMDGSELHERMLFSIYRALTQEPTCPARFGPHWEVIGFQGDDPATDLRGAGILSLLQVLHFAARRGPLLKEIYQLSRGPNDFPLMTVSINITQLTLQALRSGALHSHANRARQGLYEVVHSFYEGLFLYMFTAWKSRHLSIVNFGHLKNEIAAVSRKKPAALLKKLDDYGKVVVAGGQNGSFVDLG